MVNTGPEAPFDGTNYGQTNDHTSQVRGQWLFICMVMLAGLVRVCVYECQLQFHHCQNNGDYRNSRHSEHVLSRAM
jgi:hypothetical protein